MCVFLAGFLYVLFLPNDKTINKMKHLFEQVFFLEAQSPSAHLLRNPSVHYRVNNSQHLCQTQQALFPTPFIFIYLVL
jgi:hypothetical protein